MPASAYAAVDLGAESGRVIVGWVNDGGVSLETVHRFVNPPVTLPDGLHWNVPFLLSQVLEGLGRAASTAPLRGVGVDAWGVDYALIDRDGRMLGLPFHHRDRRTEGMVRRAHELIGREELYSVTGIQTIPINTVFQLLAEAGSAAIGAADRIALIGDLFAFWLSGELAGEATAASTTGLLDARSGRWALELIHRLRLPARPFEHELIEPGTTIGSVLREHEKLAGGAAGVPVHAVAAHDTASAFAAAPIASSRAAILSSGTWSLLGLELEEPVLTAEACAANLSNERGVDGTIRLLANVMGLWLVQQCRWHWQKFGLSHDYDELQRLALRATGDVPLFDPDDDRLLTPGDMPARIAALCHETGQRPPGTPGEFVRSILWSLACKYRLVLERLERVAGADIDVVHVIGGGARNELLCRMTAQVLGLPVLAGPVEATALGNVLVQARATGELGSRTEMRQLVRGLELTAYEPLPGHGETDEIFERFLLANGSPERAVAGSA